MATHAWHIVLRDLPEEGKCWDVFVPAAELQDASRGAVDALRDLCADMHWQGEIRRRGEVWRLVGRWRVTMRRQCDRCLAPFDWTVEGRVERNYRLAAEVRDDDEVLAFPGEIDLIDVLREEVWLAWRVRTVCRDDCKGLCPSCGADLNEGDCGCAPQADHPFAVLRTLKLG